jgi:TRAP-type uncharacterized transport system fused permease subunit
MIQDQTPALDEKTKQEVESLIRQEEGDSHEYKGFLAIFLTLAAVAMSLFHLYAAYSIVPTLQLRVVHVGFVLAIIKICIFFNGSFVLNNIFPSVLFL